MGRVMVGYAVGFAQWADCCHYSDPRRHSRGLCHDVGVFCALALLMSLAEGLFPPLLAFVVARLGAALVRAV